MPQKAQGSLPRGQAEEIPPQPENPLALGTRSALAVVLASALVRAAGSPPAFVDRVFAATGENPHEHTAQTTTKPANK